MSVHELPDIAERAGLGGRLVRRTVAISLFGVASLAALILLVLFLFEVEITVEADGILEPLEIRRVHSFASGMIKEVPTASGARVRSGDVLAQLDAFQVENELQRLRLEASHKRHRASTQRAELELLEQSLIAAEEHLRRLTIAAPMDGVLLSEELELMIGRHVVEGQMLFEIGSEGTWKAVLEVPERQIDPIRLGDAVKLTVPALAEAGSWIPEPIPATVRFIGSEPTESSTPNRSLYRVHAEVEIADVKQHRLDKFRRGMTVEARVVTRSARAVDLVVRQVKRQAGIDG